MREEIPVADTENEDVYGVLDQAIVELTKRAAEQKASKYAEGFASAVRQLAEAKAWMVSPAQDHGANGSQGD